MKDEDEESDGEAENECWAFIFMKKHTVCQSYYWVSPENIKNQKLRHTMKTLGIPLTSYVYLSQEFHRLSQDSPWTVCRLCKDSQWTPNRFHGLSADSHWIHGSVFHTATIKNNRPNLLLHNLGVKRTPIFLLSINIFHYWSISDIPGYVLTTGLVPDSLHSHTRQRYYSSASDPSARIPTWHVLLEGHWLEIPLFSPLDNSYLFHQSSLIKPHGHYLLRKSLSFTDSIKDLLYS
jgi:hypothetical protein